MAKPETALTDSRAARDGEAAPPSFPELLCENWNQVPKGDHYQEPEG